MTILRVFLGANDHKWQVEHQLKYVTDRNKHIWNGLEIPNSHLVFGYGIPIDPIIAAEEILGLHRAFGNPGKRYFYHILIDFSIGSVNPWEAAACGWGISGYLRMRGLQYLQGVHCTKGIGIEHPHVHVVVNALYPLTGVKFHIDYSFLRNFKIFANKILYAHKVPLIVLGQRTVPFYVATEKGC